MGIHAIQLPFADPTALGYLGESAGKMEQVKAMGENFQKVLETEHDLRDKRRGVWRAGCTSRKEMGLGSSPRRRTGRRSNLAFGS